MSEIIAPNDFRDTDWDDCGRVHEWKNYASDEIKVLWHSFTDEQKCAIATMLDDFAGREEWD